jgi:hypothetical protein
VLELKLDNLKIERPVLNAPPKEPVNKLKMSKPRPEVLFKRKNNTHNNANKPQAGCY